jgi:hypothetical protein
MMHPIQLDIAAVDFYKHHGHIVLRLICEDGEAYEMALTAARGWAIGNAIAEGSADVLNTLTQV